MADKKSSFGKVIGCFFYFFLLMLFIPIIMSSVFFNFRILFPGFFSFLGVFFILFVVFVFYLIATRSKKESGNSENDKAKSTQKNLENMTSNGSSQYNSQREQKSDLQDEQQDYLNEQDAIEAFEKTYERDKETNGPKSDVVYKAFLRLNLSPNSTYTQVSERYYELTKKTHQKKISEEAKEKELEELNKAYNILTEYYSKNS